MSQQVTAENAPEKTSTKTPHYAHTAPHFLADNNKSNIILKIFFMFIFSKLYHSVFLDI